MSKTKDSEGTPIMIHPSIYNEITQNAAKKNVTIKKYANELLENALRSYKYVESSFPNISYIKTSGDKIILEDSTNKEKIEPVFVEAKKESQGFNCSTDKSECCEHVIFSLLCLDVVHHLAHMKEGA